MAAFMEEKKSRYRYFKIALKIFFIFLAFYGLFSFSIWELNPGKWPLIARIFCCSWALGLVVFLADIIFEDE